MFASINQGYNRTFKAGKLTLGLVVPIEDYPHSLTPTMQHHLERVQLAEKLGFSAVWLRDVPFNVPSFGDAGQMFDPFTYLGYLAAHTEKIALGVASIILPLRHPAHIAKSAATVDVLANGRLLLGVASGDRPQEYPALSQEFENRGIRFRESFAYIRAMSESYPSIENRYGTLNGEVDILPKPVAGKIPMLITGASQQPPDWLAKNGDGWITYPRDIKTQANILQHWREGTEEAGLSIKPAAQSLYIDLVSQADTAAQPIHLGFRSGVNYLKTYLHQLEEIGINHVALNLRFNQADIETTLELLASEILLEFPSPEDS